VDGSCGPGVPCDDGNSTDWDGCTFDAAAGEKLVSEVQVNTTASSHQESPAVAVLPGGGYVVVWQDEGQDGSSTGIFGRFFGPDGAPSTGELPLNSKTVGAQSAPAVAAFADGRFVVTWASNFAQFGNDGPIGRVFEPDGQPLFEEFQMNQADPGNHQYSAVVALGNLSFVAVWGLDFDETDWDLLARPFDDEGNPQAAEFRIHNYLVTRQQFPDGAVYPTRDFVFAYQSCAVGLEPPPQDGDGCGVFARAYGPDLVPHSAAEVQVNDVWQGYQDHPAVAPAGRVSTWSPGTLCRMTASAWRCMPG